MNAQNLGESVIKYITVTKEELDYFVALFKPKKIKKKRLLFEEGDIHKQAVFVIKGCLRSYSIDKNGSEHILQFAPTGWWISDMCSLLTEQPGLLFIDAVEDSEILIISKSDLDALLVLIPKFERLFRILAERAVATYQYRLINNLSLTAIERYKNFCRIYPSLITQIPQKQVAAYIGVTLEFLSKMLNKLSLKKQNS